MSYGKPLRQHKLKKTKSLQEQKEDKIRSRQSYMYWKKVIPYFKQPHTQKEQVENLYSTLDSWSAFGSQTNADYNKESMELAMKEEGL